MLVRSAVAAVSAALLFAPAALAQDTSASPTYGSVRLSSGFSPDPYRVEITAGGTINASSAISSSCRGSIARAPDYELTYTAGNLPLYILVNASSDTTLVVNGPDGQWYCDDDSNGGTNPQVTWNSPRSGTYDIWVGTYSGGTAPATLFFTELTDGQAQVTTANDAPSYPDASRTATYGEISLSGGFQPDPRMISLTAGGTIAASAVSSSCRGSIAVAPDYQVTYSPTSLPLVFFTEASTDTTLIVNAPDGQWYCDDDSGEGSNAQVRFAKPSSGTYDIWVGTYSGGMNPARLGISEVR
jgi:hypothetical protein